MQQAPERTANRRGDQPRPRRLVDLLSSKATAACTRQVSLRRLKNVYLYSLIFVVDETGVRGNQQEASRVKGLLQEQVTDSANFKNHKASPRIL